MYVCVCLKRVEQYIRCIAARAPPPPHGIPPSRPVVVCGSLWCGFPLAPPPVVAVSCAPFHGYCWLGVRLLRVWTLGCDTVQLNSDLH